MAVNVATDPLTKSIAYLEKSFGKGVVLKLDGAVEQKLCVTTGHPFVDYVLGGGFYYGKHHELYGRESSGKSTLAYTVAAQVQRKKLGTGRVLILDYENSFDLKYFKRLGGDPKLLLVSQPTTAEEGFEVLRELIDNSLIDAFVADSVAAMMAFKESAYFVNSVGDQVASDSKGAKQAGEMGEMHIGLHARVISQGLKQLSMRMAKHNVMGIWINQIRTQINTNRPASETTTGGNALKFYAAVRLELRKLAAKQGKIHDPFENKIKDANIAIKTLVKGAKNKEAPPFREAPVTITFGNGLSVEDDMLDFAVAHKIVPKGNTGWYETKTIGAKRNARGEEDFKKLLREEPDIRKRLLEKVTQNIEKVMDTANYAVVEDTASDQDLAMGDDAGISSILETAGVTVPEEKPEMQEASATDESL